MRTAILSISLLLLLIASSCKKSQSTTTATVTANATIVNSGEIAADGCGWIIKLDDQTEFSPVNLSTDLEQDNLKVSITYTRLSTYTGCGMLAGNPGMHQIKINSIEKAN
jgi:hypothetical protein